MHQGLRMQCRTSSAYRMRVAEAEKEGAGTSIVIEKPKMPGSGKESSLGVGSPLRRFLSTASAPSDRTSFPGVSFTSVYNMKDTLRPPYNPRLSSVHRVFDFSYRSCPIDSQPKPARTFCSTRAIPWIGIHGDTKHSSAQRTKIVRSYYPWGIPRAIGAT